MEILYVTDLHLDVKFRSEFGSSYKEKADMVMNARVREFMSGRYSGTASGASIVLIGGDVASDFDVARSFYRELSRNYFAIAILGNHEFWDPRTHGDGDPVDGCVETYSKMLGKYLLHNSLFVYPLHGISTTLSEQEILEWPIERIRSFTAESRLVVFGTTGFAALDDAQNAESGMYRSAITSREQEAVYSSRADAVYRKLMEALSEQPIVVLSHMPLHSWSTAGYVPKWTYIHGHNHQNNVTVNNGAIDYGDNQIGYGGIPHLKNILVNTSNDVFLDVPDGIHEVSVSDYRRFMAGRGMPISSCKIDNVIMLKRDGLYMFLTNNDSNLCLLDGGARIRVAQSVEYYYENIPRYADSVRRFAKMYNTVLDDVSRTVKMMGGDGRIHGCIVDLDYYNHIFLNPFDGKLTPYYATSMRDKYVYPSVKMLVEKRCPALKSGYKEIVRAGEYNLPAVDTGSKKPIYYPDTDIYRYSRFMHKIQHQTGRYVIRQWNDAFLNLDNPEAPLMAVKALIGTGRGNSP